MVTKLLEQVLSAWLGKPRVTNSYSKESGIMPIWIKLIVILWVTAFVGWIFLRIWAIDNVKSIAIGKYPLWVYGVGLLFIASILSIIPFFIWLLFFR